MDMFHQTEGEVMTITRGSPYCLQAEVLILVFRTVIPIWELSLLSSSVYSKVMNSKKEWQGYLEIRTRKLLTIGFLVFIIM